MQWDHFPFSGKENHSTKILNYHRDFYPHSQGLGQSSINELVITLRHDFIIHALLLLQLFNTIYNFIKYLGFFFIEMVYQNTITTSLYHVQWKYFGIILLSTTLNFLNIALNLRSSIFPHIRPLGCSDLASIPQYSRNDKFTFYFPTDNN